MTRSAPERLRLAAVEVAEHPAGRIALAAVTLVIGLSIYHFLNRTLPPRVDFFTPLDAAIPFMPWTIVVYMSMYLMFGAASLVVKGKDFVRGLEALILVNVVSFLGFMLFTSHYPRPSPSVIEVEWLASMFTWMFSADPPGNTFPSLHVGTTATAAAMLWRKPGRWIWVVWAALICLSTLTVKQHFVADLVGGLVVAALAFLWIDRADAVEHAVRPVSPKR